MINNYKKIRLIKYKTDNNLTPTFEMKEKRKMNCQKQFIDQNERKQCDVFKIPPRNMLFIINIDIK